MAQIQRHAWDLVSGEQAVHEEPQALSDETTLFWYLCVVGGKTVEEGKFPTSNPNTDSLHGAEGGPWNTVAMGNV